MDIDGLFINSLMFADAKQVKEAFKKVPVEMVEGIERGMYEFIRNYYKSSNGSIPSFLALKRKFSEFVRVKPDDTIYYYCDELRDRLIYQIMTEYNSRVQNKLFAKDLDGAKEEYHKMRNELSEISLIESETAGMGLEERIEEAYQAKENKGIIGLQTGIEVIDVNMGGLIDEFVVLIGKRGAGKTFLALMIMNAVWTQLEGSIAVISNELSKKKMHKRTDSIVTKINYSRYRKGQLTKLEFKKLERLKKTYKIRHDLFVIPGGGKHLDEIEDEINTIDPPVAFIIVDGIYLTNMGKKSEYENLVAASRGYKRLKDRLGIPLIATSQMNKEEEAKYALALEEDADVVIRMFQTPEMYIDQIMGLQFTKVREEKPDEKCYLNWDFDNWNFTTYDMSVADESMEQTYE